MKDEKRLLEVREQAIALRRAGKSRREIMAITGISNNEFLTDALRRVPPPEWTRRPNAKDDLRARARELRATGMAYNEIVRELGVSKGSVSLWVRDMPRLSSEELQLRRGSAGAAYWQGERLRRASDRRATCEEASRDVGELSDREVLIAGALAYWCEGSKRKTRRPQDQVIFTNSDPGLVGLFLRFLQVAGIPAADLVCRLQIHDDADMTSAHEYWQGVTGLSREQFARPTLKQPVLADSELDLTRRLTAGPASRRPRTVQPALRDQAVTLRLAGMYRREIRQALRIGSNETLNTALRDVPPPAWNRHPGYEKGRQLAAAGAARYWERKRRERAGRLRSLAEHAAGQIGRLSDRDLMIGGAVVYWCEGSKNKAHRQEDRVVFINSDPGLIRLFQRFTSWAGIADHRLVCRVHIHERGDVEAAEQFWRAETGLPAEQFRRPTLKHHVPKTAWPERQPDYHGCLIISVRKGREFYQHTEGWAAAVMSNGFPARPGSAESVSEPDKNLIH